MPVFKIMFHRKKPQITEYKRTTYAAFLQYYISAHISIYYGWQRCQTTNTHINVDLWHHREMAPTRCFSALGGWGTALHSQQHWGLTALVWISCQPRIPADSSKGLATSLFCNIQQRIQILPCETFVTWKKWQQKSKPVVLLRKLALNEKTEVYAKDI